jgi:hypothetical protein
MLSKQVKQRIARNKKRRIECRTKTGRDLFRLVRSVRQRTTNQAVKFLLGQADDLAITKSGFSEFMKLIPQGGFKRGELNIFAALHTPYRERKTTFTEDLAADMGSTRNISLEADREFIIGLDPAANKPAMTLMKIIKGKPRGPNIASLFDIDPNMRNMHILDESHLLDDGAIKLNAEESQRFNELRENPPPANDKLKAAMTRFREGVKDGTAPSITLDSYSDFGVRGHVDKDGKFTMDSVNLIDNPEKRHGTE